MQGHKRPPLNAVQVAVDREGLYEICMGLSVFNVLKEERHQTIQGRAEGFQHSLGVIHKPRGQLRGEGVGQMTIL